MHVVVAIPTLNEEEHIEDLVLSMLNEKARFSSLEIAIADGGSTDRTVEIATSLSKRFSEVHFIRNRKKIQSAAINEVAKLWKDKADILVRCDAHSLYPTNFISNLIGTLRKTKATSVVVPMDSVGVTCMQKAIAWVSDTPVGSGGAAHRGGNVSGFVDHGHHAAIRLTDFLAVGGYDESFITNEDAELDSRLRQNGGSIYLDAGTRIKYFPRRTLKDLFTQYFKYGKGRAMTLMRHPHSVRPRQLSVLVNFFALIFSVAAAGIFQNLAMLAWPALYSLILTATSVLIMIQKHSFCGILAAPAAFVMHMSWALGFLNALLLGEKTYRAANDVALSQP